MGLETHAATRAALALRAKRMASADLDDLVPLDHTAELDLDVVSHASPEQSLAEGRFRGDDLHRDPIRFGFQPPASESEEAHELFASLGRADSDDGAASHGRIVGQVLRGQNIENREGSLELTNALALRTGQVAGLDGACVLVVLGLGLFVSGGLFRGLRGTGRDLEIPLDRGPQRLE